MFIKEEDKKYRVIFSNGSQIESTLKPGVYSLDVKESMFGDTYYLNEVNLYVGKKMINAGVYKEINNMVNIHLSPSMTEAKRLLNLKNKLGLMFNGNPGTGKTFTAGLLGQRIVDQLGGYCIITTTADGKRDRTIINKFRSFTDKPIVYIYDEFEKSFDRFDSQILSFLDGVDSPENIVIIATTNKIDDLPDYVIDRPGRFERVIQFREDDKAVLRAIVSSMIPKKFNTGEFFSIVSAKFDKSENKTIDKILLIVRDCLAKQIYKLAT